jgi:hypothetical protein
MLNWSTPCCDNTGSAFGCGLEAGYVAGRQWKKARFGDITLVTRIACGCCDDELLVILNGTGVGRWIRREEGQP